MKRIFVVCLGFSGLICCLNAESKVPGAGGLEGAGSETLVSENTRSSSRNYFDEFLIEAKAAYFLPMGRRFEKIYHGGGIYGLEFSFKTKDFLYAWTSVDFFSKSGHGYGSFCEGHSSTKIFFVPLGAGLKIFFPVSILDLWLGGGVLTTYVHVKDEDLPVISKWGVGGILKGGALVNWTNYLFLDFFADYSFMTVSFNDSLGGTVIPYKGDLSGWSFGASLGFRFGKRYKR